MRTTSIFLIDKETGKDTDGRLRFRIKWSNNTVAFNVGYRVEFDKWSKDTQRCKNNTTHGKKRVAAAVINREINRFEKTAEDIINSHTLSNTSPSREEFIAAFNKAIGKTSEDNEKSKDLFNYFDDFVKETSQINNWTPHTHRRFNIVKKHLLKFNPDLRFSDLTQTGLAEYITFLTTTENLTNSTATKQLKQLKRFLRWALANNYTSNNEYAGYKPKLKISDKKIIFLTWEELMTIYHFDIPKNKEYLMRVRDVFCFCCFTSLRYSDVANLRRANIFYPNYISITTIKTSDSLRIDLNDYSREIIKRYETEHFPNNLAFPIISNQKMNVYLKELGKLCGINEDINTTYYQGNQRIDEINPKYKLIGTHCARRTFICNALSLGIPAHIVMKWTGHSDYKAMKPYIDVADNVKSEAMSLFNKKVPDIKK